VSYSRMLNDDLNLVDVGGVEHEGHVGAGHQVELVEVDAGCIGDPQSGDAILRPKIWVKIRKKLGKNYFFGTFFKIMKKVIMLLTPGANIIKRFKTAS
jgi:hypothetical protein